MAHKKNPRNYKVSERGYAPRGPERWIRAATNALNNPTSGGGKLFLKRLDLADDVALKTRELYDRTYCHMRKSWNGEWERKYYTCSAHCTVMQVALDAQIDDIDAFRSLLALDLRFSFYQSEPRSAVVVETPSRQVRCQVCAGEIYADGTSVPKEWLKGFKFIREEELPLDAEETPMPEEPNDITHTFFVNVADGTLVMPDHLRLIVVTDREGMLLLSSSNTTISQFGQKYGTPVV